MTTPQHSPTKNPTTKENTWEKFLIIESVEKEGATLDKPSPFAVHKYIAVLVGEDAAVKKLKSSSLLVEASNKSQKLKITMIFNAQ